MAVLVIAASLLYPGFATVPRLRQRFATQLGPGTLNALDWMQYGTVPLKARGTDNQLVTIGAVRFSGDFGAIQWFWDNVDGSPVIAEASIGPYRCNGSRISVNTGLPTILGWERHEQQQRYPDTLAQRSHDARWLYVTPDPAEKLAILRLYEVRYVVLGDLERYNVHIDVNDCVAEPQPAGIAAFERMVGTSLREVFDENGTVIYEVLQDDAT